MFIRTFEKPIKTARLTIRRPSPKDARALHAFYRNAALEIEAFFVSVSPAWQGWGAKTLQIAKQDFEKEKNYFKEEVAWWQRRDDGFYIRANNYFIFRGEALIGFLMAYTLQQHPRIAYFIAPAFRRQQFATEALSNFLLALRQKKALEKIHAIPPKNNQASRGVLRRLGYRDKGASRHYKNLGIYCELNLSCLRVVRPVHPSLRPKKITGSLRAPH